MFAVVVIVLFIFQLNALPSVSAADNSQIGINNEIANNLENMSHKIVDIIENPQNYIEKESIEKNLNISMTSRSLAGFEVEGYFSGVMKEGWYNFIDLAEFDAAKFPRMSVVTGDPRAAWFGPIRSELAIHIRRPRGMRVIEFLKALHLEAYRGAIKASGWKAGKDAAAAHFLSSAREGNSTVEVEQITETYFRRRLTAGTPIELRITYPSYEGDLNAVADDDRFLELSLFGVPEKGK